MDYIMTATTFTGVTSDDRTITVDHRNANWSLLKTAVRDKDWSLVEDLADMAKAVTDFGQGKIVVQDGVIFFEGVAVHNTVTERIIRMMSEGFDVTPMVLFLENLMENPSNRSIADLYRFLEHNALPITGDGCFLAYKMVNDDFTDARTGEMDNSVGATVEMPRRDVEDNPDVTCSTGLHFCSVDYLSSHWGSTIVILKVNPADVVSIPTDYNNAKGRACKYQVVGVHQEGHDHDSLADSVVNEDYDAGYEDGYEDGYNEAAYQW
jgi:hypothetical protein